MDRVVGEFCGLTCCSLDIGQSHGYVLTLQAGSWSPRMEFGTNVVFVSSESLLKLFNSQSAEAMFVTSISLHQMKIDVILKPLMS